MNNQTTSRMVPQNVEMEYQVLSGLYFNHKDFAEFIMPPDTFYDAQARKAYEAMLKLFHEEKTVNDMVMLSEASGLPFSFFTDLAIANWVSNFQLKQNVGYLLFKRRQRVLWELAHRIYNYTDQLRDEKELLEFEAQLVETLTDNKDDSDEAASISSIARRLWDESATVKHVPIINSGFPTLDRLSMGLRPGFLWAVGAASGTGKSFFVLNLILEALKQKKKIALFSLEMSQDINFFRLLGMRANASALDLADGSLNGRDDAVQDGYGWLADQGLWIYDDKMTCKEIYERTRRLNSKNKLDMIVIDYLQLVSGPGSLYENMSEAVNTANRIAKVCKCSVILVSQLSNETLKAGVKSDLPGYKGAGDIVAGVDLGLILERPKNKDGDMLMNELHVKIIKNRHNPSGNAVIKLHIDYPSGLITEVGAPVPTPAEIVDRYNNQDNT